MTEEEGDRAHEVKELILKSMKIFVDNCIREAKLTPEQEEEVRQQLTEQARFWKGY